jgi:hypothetical protein
MNHDAQISFFECLSAVTCPCVATLYAALHAVVNCRFKLNACLLWLQGHDGIDFIEVCLLCFFRIFLEHWNNLHLEKVKNCWCTAAFYFNLQLTWSSQWSLYILVVHIEIDSLKPLYSITSKSHILLPSTQINAQKVLKGCPTQPVRGCCYVYNRGKILEHIPFTLILSLYALTFHHFYIQTMIEKFLLKWSDNVHFYIVIVLIRPNVSVCLAWHKQDSQIIKSKNLGETGRS